MRLAVPGIHRSLGVAALLAYALVSLWPFTWAPPYRVTNGATPLPEGNGIRFFSPGVAQTHKPPAWIEEARRTNRIEVFLRVRPSLSKQGGPARIFTLSRNSWDRILTISQQNDDLVVRFRTDHTSINGTIDGSKPFMRIPGAFRRPGWIAIAIAIAPGEFRARVGDRPEIRSELSSTPLRRWHPSHHLALGNEVTGGRPWLGEIAEARVVTTGGSRDYANAAHLEFPLEFWIVRREPKLQPFRYLHGPDAINNLLLYIPLGILFGIIGRRHGRVRVARAILLVAGISAAMEIAQLFISVRNPSINDVIFNAIGGGVGVALAQIGSDRCTFP